MSFKQEVIDAEGNPTHRAWFMALAQRLADEPTFSLTPKQLATHIGHIIVEHDEAQEVLKRREAAVSTQEAPASE